MDKYERCAATEMAEGFDRTLVEDALQDVLGGPEVYESCVPGVVAFERDDKAYFRVNWDEIARKLSAAVGVGVLAVAPCDWTFDDRGHDEEAVLIAFNIPSCPADYRVDCRNLITPFEHVPSAAPSP